ncbi:hypothetical protein LK540_19200 [Massilia sp. IC2-278]|uniref:hypothetical protein n=1 Tax=Massilia sp. IC2-278 TaxID=2887200 RepID=UPI001E45DD59|nr:hypothetical protein [Massilia sp. IC2-278]MCC2962559.1 hypothetical protein [Massilia sp. IC2-278]
MKKQVVSVSILQNAKVMAALYFAISLPFTLLMTIPALMGQGQGAGFSIVMLVLMPFLYTLIGFVFTLVGAWVYNVIAARIGGFEFTTAEVGK